MICVDAPDERATLDLALTLPSRLQAAGNGRALSKVDLGDGRTLHRWHLKTPMPSYVYGFAAGRYTKASERMGGIQLRYLSMQHSQEELRRIFGGSADMLLYFGQMPQHRC